MNCDVKGLCWMCDKLNPMCAVEDFDCSFTVLGYQLLVDSVARDGAKVMVSSRKQSNVDKAVASLQKQYGQDVISGVVCHVGRDDDRKQLIKEVSGQIVCAHVGGENYLLMGRN